MFKLLKQLKAKEWLMIFIAICFIVLQVFLDLKMPDYMNTITQISQGGINQATGQQYTLSEIWINGLYMLLCALGSLASSIITSFFIVKVASNFSARIRKNLYTKVQGFSLAEINKFNTSSLITRTTNDVQQVQMFLTMGLQLLIKSPITAVWAIIKIAGKQWQWSLAVGVAVAFMLICIIIIIALVIKKFAKIQKLTDNLNKVTRENLSGIRIIRANNAEKYQTSKFEKVNDEYTNTQLYTGKITSAISPVISLTLNGISLAIYWIGAIIINKASLLEVKPLFADMVVFLSYGMQIISSFMMLVMVFMFAPRAIISAKRIMEVLSVKETISDGAGVLNTQEKGTVEFKNVCFHYPDASENVLTDISFKVNKGQTIALIGSTGCGKTTIVNLISRFFDATEGEVLVDGHNVKEYTKSQLSQKIGYVSQKATLFSGDIRENINFGDNKADDKLLNKAIEISQSDDFIYSKTDGLDSHVSQNGSNFSGGQKQRLSIARALARNAEIYIFDDTFSALDYKTDKILRSELKEEMHDSTCIIVAQRIGTIMDADLILVIDDGKIVGKGTHKELLKTNKTYQEIAFSQLSKEELENA